MNRIRLKMAALLTVAFIAGCANPLQNTSQRQSFYVIEDLRRGQVAPSASASRIDAVLMVSTGTAPALFDSERMVFTRDGVGRSYYHHASWSGRPSRRITELAEARLSSTDDYRAVVQSVAGVRGDLLLTLRIDELTHDDSVQPGQMRLAVVAELVDWRHRRFIQRQRFEHSAPVVTADAQGASQAANVAATALLDSLAVWTRAGAQAVSLNAPRP